MKVKSLSRVRLLATPWTAAHQAPPSMGFSRQEYWSGVPPPSPHMTKLVHYFLCLAPYFLMRAEAQFIWLEYSFQFSSVAQSCSTLWDSMNCSMSGLPVHHQLPELAQTHVHRVGDAIQPTHPLSSPSLPAFSLFQHQGLFQ